MLIQYDPSWDDRSSSWWAKTDRAKTHLDSLRHQVDEFRAADPYSLTPEATDKPERIAYRLRYLKPVPVGISTTTGDVLHNLRGTLESLAFEAARQSQGGTLTAEQERQSTFPICETPDKFDAFFTGRRTGLYNDKARKAFRSVQPFAIVETAKEVGVDMDGGFTQAFQFDQLHCLDALWNIDKHRRLIPAIWWPYLFYWGSNDPSNKKAYPGDGTLADGSILLYIEGKDEGFGDELSHEFNLVLKDDPAFVVDKRASHDLVDVLNGFYGHIVNNVFPKVFTFMSES